LEIVVIRFAKGFTSLCLVVFYGIWIWGRGRENFEIMRDLWDIVCFIGLIALVIGLDAWIEKGTRRERK
jgi:hypothetical protein